MLRCESVSAPCLSRTVRSVFFCPIPDMDQFFRLVLLIAPLLPFITTPFFGVVVCFEEIGSS